MNDTVCVVITSHEQFAYTARAVESCLAHTPNAFVLVVDDASPSWPRAGPPPAPLDRYWGTTSDRLFEHRVGFVRFDTPGGLTRSWNAGLQLTRDGPQSTYTVLSNNDVVFTPGWFAPLVLGLTRYDLVGPLTNAPGPTARGLQDVTRWLPDYRPDDADNELAATAEALRDKYPGRTVEARVNGFCFAATTAQWWANAYSPKDNQVFCPLNTHNSKGQPNPTPTMTLMEDEYQHRLYRRGGTAAVCLDSFVLHYRSVTRGDRYKQGRWLRRKDG